jgi:heterotetrameric sarcosine oxidase gamma subunit
MHGGNVTWDGTAIPVHLREGLRLFRVKFAGDAAQGAKALSLPDSGHATPTALAIGPQDWLLIHPDAEAGATAAAIAVAGGYAIEVSDALIVLDCDNADQMLGRLTGLDVACFGPGRTGRTRLAGIAVVLTGLDVGGVRMIFDRSYARHMRRYLDLAA